MKITWYILCAGLLIGGLSEPASAQKMKSEPVKEETVQEVAETVQEVAEPVQQVAEPVQQEIEPESQGGINASAASYSADAPINEILIAMLLLAMGKSLLCRKNEETI
jgi:hypothetical protein